MRHENFVVFHNDSDSSYMNSADNFRGAEIGAAQRIDIYFESALSTGIGGSYDRVRLIVDAAGNEEKALEAIAGALQGNKSGLTVMADDKLGTYFSDFFTGVDSFTTASLNQRKIVQDITVATNIEASDSGKVFAINKTSGAYSITLPTVAEAGAGWFATFVITTQAANIVKIISDASEDTLIGVTIGADTDGDGASVVSGVDEVAFIAATEKGDKVEIFCDGTSFYCNAFTHDADHVTIS